MIACRATRRPGTFLFGRMELSASVGRQRRLVQSLAAVSFPKRTSQQLRYSSSNEKQSNRAAFRATPVDPKLLEYIERIGVGIPAKRRRKSPRRKQTRKYSRKHDTAVLDSQEEVDFFRQRLQNVAKERRARKKNSSASSRSSSVSWLPPPPFASTPEASNDEDDATSAGYKVKRHPVKVIGSVGSLDERFPKNKGIPEVAVAGRSNVGKSTLLNALLYGNQDCESTQHPRRRGKVPNGKKLPKGIKAITSDRPGETRKITFYQLSSEILFPSSGKANMSLLLVDLPGYGFAYASEEKAHEWRELMKDYILHRGKSLKRVLLLIDARHGLKKADRDFLENLQSVLYSESQQDDGHGKETVTKSKTKKKRELPPIQLVLTKCDLVSQTDLARRVVLAKEQLSDCLRREPSSLPVMLVSAKPGVGFNNVQGDRALGGVLELQREIAALAPEPKQVARQTT